MSQSHGELDLLNELAESYLQRYRRGERPALSEYTRQHPDLAAQIEEYFPALAVMEEFGSVGAGRRDLQGDSVISRQRCRSSWANIGSCVCSAAAAWEPCMRRCRSRWGGHVALKVLPLHAALQSFADIRVASAVVKSTAGA
jgi:hypothetical protein